MKPPVGVVLAGGAGRRIGGDKAIVELSGRPLLDYPLAALDAVVADRAVIAKRSTALPPLPDGAVAWMEPDEPRHPLMGIVYALQLSDMRPVLVCAVDQPLVTPAVLREICASASVGDLAVVPRAGGRLQPLCALYFPALLNRLRWLDFTEPLMDVVRTLNPRIVDFDDDEPFFNVNAPEDLLVAGVALASRT